MLAEDAASDRWSFLHTVDLLRKGSYADRWKRKALQTIKKAIDNDDWRAAVAALKLVFPEYRDSTKLDVTTTANISSFVLTEEMRLKRIERREKAL